MLTNRFFNVLVIVALAAVVGLTVREAVVTSAIGSELEEAERIQQSWAADTARYPMDSGTRSYIAWGEALDAAGKLGDSDVCSTTTQENIFDGIDSNLDSATRSYIAWGLASQAKNDIHGCH